MNAAQTIAETLDRHLERPTEVVVFGAGALLLDPKFAAQLRGRTTNDIDVIIPLERELHLDADESFWRAVRKTNSDLDSQGLYITHIFPEREVALTPEWKNHLVSLHHPELSKLSLARPRILDLVVTKMGRGDAQDRVDVRTMLQLHRAVTGQNISEREIADAASRARVPEIYREIFPKASAQIIAVAHELAVVEEINARAATARQGLREGHGHKPSTGPRFRP